MAELDTSSPPLPVRKIIHIDMDAFFASVEQRDAPALRGLPVAVGSEAGRGVVAAASYEARRFGVKSAMPSALARRLCPDLIFVKARFDAYRAVSTQIRAIFAQHTDLIEPLSLDEAYLDVTQNKRSICSAQEIAGIIRADIKRETLLTASAGVSYNKFIAKLASDQNKPDGMCVIPPARGADFVASLPVRRFHGVGPRTAEKMAAHGIVSGADLRAKDKLWMMEHFGSWGEYLYLAARGIDHRPVCAHRTRKSIGAERTYGQDKWHDADLHTALDEIIATVWDRIQQHQAHGKTVTLKVKFSDFEQITRAHSPGHLVQDVTEFSQIAHRLIGQILPVSKGVRLLGLTLSALGSEADMDQPALQAELPF